MDDQKPLGEYPYETPVSLEPVGNGNGLETGSERKSGEA